jgi:NADPH:quinone reductase-like Zn-dependent oxidoreductase
MDYGTLQHENWGGMLVKAIVCTRYGPPELLRLEEVDKPAPGDGEVLVKVRAASVNYSTVAFVTGKPSAVRVMGGGLLKPKYRIPGAEVAGQVEAVGRNVTQFQPGDDVFGDLSASGRGGYAEYVAAPQTAFAGKPAGLSFAEAAAVPETALVALQGLRDKGGIQPEQKVLICGASGGIGTFAVQIAKSFGAEVTGVCGTRNLDLVRSLGADHVIDYSKEDFARRGERYGLILATAGYRSVFDYRRALTPTGTYVVTGGSTAQVFQPMLLGPLLSLAGKKKTTNLILRLNQEDLVFMKELIEAGKVKPLIDRTYPFNEVPEALRYYDQGHSQGKVVITLE